MKTFDVAACADFLKIHRTTVLKLVASGDLPGAKIGRAWVFLETDLIDYIRNAIRSQSHVTTKPQVTEAMRAEPIGRKRKVAPDLSAYTSPHLSRQI
jgi:excisionase family DNA binding protein